jgi:hypothetical protein
MKKLKPILIILVAVIAALAISQWVNHDGGVSSTNPTVSTQVQEYRSADFYHQLTENQKRIYDAMLPAVMDGNNNVRVEDVDFTTVRDDMTMVSKAFENDHPELFWFRQFRKAANYGDWVEFTIMYYSYKSPMFDTEEKYDELMNVEMVQNFIDFLETIDKKIKETKKDKTFEMMIGRYKKLSEEDFKKMIERQVSAFKASREKSEEDELEEILNEIA